VDSDGRQADCVLMLQEIKDNKYIQNGTIEDSLRTVYEKIEFHKIQGWKRNHFIRLLCIAEVIS